MTGFFNATNPHAISISLAYSWGMKAEKMKAVFLLGTLKWSPEFSHTDVLSRYLADHLERMNVESDIIRLADYHIEPGIETKVAKPDDWPELLKRVLAADIIIFATPIWWGGHSSLLQRVIERLDALNDELLETGHSEFENKVGGIVITGGEDGVQHIIGMLTNFMSWNGLTVPPACSLSWIGGGDDTEATLMRKFADSDTTRQTAEIMSRNLAFLARLLKEHPVPTK